MEEGWRKKMKKQSISIKINNEKKEISVLPNELLINVIREEMGLTGTKCGCGMGQCGSCTVLIDGTPVLSCLTLALTVDGAEITTIEGFERSDGTLDKLQESFIDNSAIQCGFCTPGMVLMGSDLLTKNPSPTEVEIRAHIKGNICRCTGYYGIVRAIKHAAVR
jgi:carbon-monoxide dehydrogenase small subunit